MIHDEKASWSRRFSAVLEAARCPWAASPGVMLPGGAAFRRAKKRHAAREKVSGCLLNTGASAGRMFEGATTLLPGSLLPPFRVLGGPQLLVGERGRVPGDLAGPGEVRGGFARVGHPQGGGDEA